MNNRGRGVRNNRTPGARAQVQMLKSSLHGHQNVLKATNPPPFNRKPYNTITIEKVFPGTSGLQTVTVASILSSIRAQLDLAEPAPIMFKMQRIDLWVMTPGGGVDSPNIRGKFYSLVANSSDAAAVPDRVPLKFLEDSGTYGASAAVVSYSWPRDQQDMPLGSANAVNVPIYQYEVGGSLTPHHQLPVFARYHIHWNTMEFEPITPASLSACSIAAMK